MRYEREVPEHAKFADVKALKVGSEYFVVSFADDAMLCPSVEALIFVGMKLDGETQNCWYFQDAASYYAGVRFDVDRPGERAVFTRFESATDVGVCQFDDALDIILNCAMQRVIARHE